jgi:glycosyltransferase involved in cell wall biosynthesis
MKRPDITVVVCTFNRAEMLGDALRSLYDLATDGRFQYEVLVIDNASTDATPATIANAANESAAPLRSVYEAEKGIVAARNRGVAAARGEWIAFFDDDQLADPRWLVELFAMAESRDCRLVGGAVHLKLPRGCDRQLAPMTRMLLGESIWSDQPLSYTKRIGPGAGNLMLHRSVFEDIGLFDAAVGSRGEDTELFLRADAAGFAAWYAPAAIVQHVIPALRLETPFLAKLAERMGEGIARWERQERKPASFAARYLIKNLRALAWHLPRWLALRIAGDREAALDMHCRLALDRGYARVGWRQLVARLPAVEPKTPQPNIKLFCPPASSQCEVSR